MISLWVGFSYSCHDFMLCKVAMIGFWVQNAV